MTFNNVSCATCYNTEGTLDFDLWYVRYGEKVLYFRCGGHGCLFHDGRYAFGGYPFTDWHSMSILRFRSFVEQAKKHVR